MFSWQHFVWLFICALLITASLVLYEKKKPSFRTVLTYCCIICFLSEFTKVFNVIEMVPSEDGSMIFPYLPMNHLPLHLCSLQILLIVYLRLSENEKTKENLMVFMFPSCILGALSALLMPSIFTTSITVDQAFTSPMAYQFFIFHSMLIVLGVIIAKCGVIEWKWEHYFRCMAIAVVLGFISLYVNSIFASPTYLNGKLLHVDFWPNFMFSYNNPLGIRITTLTGWYLYLVILLTVIAVLCFICFFIVIRKKPKKA